MGKENINWIIFGIVALVIFVANPQLEPSAQSVDSGWADLGDDTIGFLQDMIANTLAYLRDHMAVLFIGIAAIVGLILMK